VTVKETALEFLPPHDVVDITPTPPETNVLPPFGGLNTENNTVTGLGNVCSCCGWELCSVKVDDYGFALTRQRLSLTRLSA
jgi:hypothetical protein